MDVRLRAGGSRWAQGQQFDGTNFETGGLYLDVDAPFLLIKTWKSCRDDGPNATVSCLREKIDGGTRLTIRHDCFNDRDKACQEHAKN
jgi:uncharacterized protein YndB with AHSA1/START domain